MATHQLTFGSLFAGIGGLDLGLERAGMECRWQIEIDPFCVRVLARHWPEIKRYGDIRSITGNELEPVDLICGGFPCQDLSQAGKRRGIEGTRSGLWFEFARLVGRLGPRWVLIENVPGLLVHDAMRRVIGELARCGYVGCWRSLRASEFGASHLRKRVFIVAYRAGDRPGGGGETHNQHGNHASWHEPDGRDPQVAHSSSRGPRIEQNEPRQSCEGRSGPEPICPQLAHSSSRRFGERRQPPGSDGLPDGSDEELADSGSGLRRKAERITLAELLDERGRKSSPSVIGPDNQELADTEQPRCDRRQGTELRTDGSTLSTARPGEGDGRLEDARRAGLGRTPEPAGLDRTGAPSHDCGTSGTLADSARDEQPGLPREDGGMRRRRVCESGEQLAHTECTGLEIRNGKREQQLRQIPEPLAPSVPTFAPGPADPRWPGILEAKPDLAPALESPIRGVADGLSDWMDRAMSNRTKRLGRLGNAVVPECAEWIGRKILEFEKRRVA